MTSEEQIQISNISFKYPRGKQIFTDFSCVFKTGNIYAVVGPNGVGKTTLGKLMLGLLKPDSGSITINDKKVSDMTLGEVGNYIGYVFQNPAKQLFATSVFEELSFPLLLQGEEQEVVNGLVEEKLEQFSLTQARDTFPFYLSQGEKQRLVMAGILLGKPKFLVLDEPTTALDIVRKKELRELLMKISKEQKIAIIMISHDHAFIEAMNAKRIELKR
ncbi:MAG: energy-coupling factor ABC transporter ATP-binding protein [Lachnospiraceae bacterium]